MCMQEFVKKKLDAHKSFVAYTWVGIVITILTIGITSFFIDVLHFPAWLTNSVVIAGFFVLKYFMYKWAGFAR